MDPVLMHEYRHLILLADSIIYTCIAVASKSQTALVLLSKIILLIPIYLIIWPCQPKTATQKALQIITQTCKFAIASDEHVAKTW